jgi:hypothetical protein
MPIKWPEIIASACVGLYKTPREILEMTVAELELLSCYQPEAKTKKQTMGLLDPGEVALQARLEYMQLTPRQKLEKRWNERES